MLTRRVITCLDVRAGRVVKGVRFEALREIGDPADLAWAYQQQGADEVVMLDVSATLDERLASLQAVERIRSRLSIPLTVGGGVRSAQDARRLLDAGADRVSVNSAAVARPELIAELADRFGTQCVVLAVDAQRHRSASAAAQPTWRVSVRSGTSPVDVEPCHWAAQGQTLGAGEILLTSIDSDGTGSGYDLQLLAAVSGSVSMPIIASGGARTPDDLAAAVEAGADAVLVASMVHDGAWTVGEIKARLAERGLAIRPPQETAT